MYPYFKCLTLPSHIGKKRLNTHFLIPIPVVAALDSLSSMLHLACASIVRYSFICEIEMLMGCSGRREQFSSRTLNELRRINISSIFDLHGSMLENMNRRRVECNHSPISSVSTTIVTFAFVGQVRYSALGIAIFWFISTTDDDQSFGNGNGNDKNSILTKQLSEEDRVLVEIFRFMHNPLTHANQFDSKVQRRVTGNISASARRAIAQLRRDN